MVNDISLKLAHDISPHVKPNCYQRLSTFFLTEMIEWDGTNTQLFINV
jgi:hypothetical protein